MEISLDPKKYCYITRKIEITTAITDFICFKKYIEENKEIQQNTKEKMLKTINTTLEYFENELYRLKKDYLSFCYPLKDKKNL